ncbi:MAG: hypothetical protein WCG21_01715 [Eubacteriales bacterium]
MSFVKFIKYQLDKYKVMFVLVIVLVLLAYYLIVSPFFLYKPSEDGKAADLLAYQGSILSTIGTLFLGAVAIFQNRSIARKDAKFRQLELKQQIKEIMPELVRKFNISHKSSQIRFYLENTSKYPAYDIYLDDLVIEYFDNLNDKTPTFDICSIRCLHSEEKQLITINTHFNNNQGKQYQKCSFTLRFYDMVDVGYFEEISAIFNGHIWTEE